MPLRLHPYPWLQTSIFGPLTRSSCGEPQCWQNQLQGCGSLPHPLLPPPLSQLPVPFPRPPVPQHHQCQHARLNCLHMVAPESRPSRHLRPAQWQRTQVSRLQLLLTPMAVGAAEQGLEMCLNGNGSQRQRPFLTERERPLHPFPLQLLLAAVAAAIN